MMKTTKIITIVLTVILIIGLPVSVFAAPNNNAKVKTDKLNTQNYGVRAYQHIKYLSQEIGRRTAGTETEKKAAEYIKSELEKMGYPTSEKEFTYKDRRGNEFNSQNILAYRPAKNGAKNPPTVIIGAHYDSTGSASEGAHDNASGTASVLEAAERLGNTPLDYNIVFALFGAEEAGYRGSTDYVNNMTQSEKDNTLVMINLDSVIGGDYLYIHGNEGEKGWARDQLMQRVKKLDLNIRIQPGLNPDYPAGVGYPASDHVPFENAGIAYVNYESTNWEADQTDSDMTGYEETVKLGAIWHTKYDKLSVLETEFPGRVGDRLWNCTLSLSDFLKTMDNPYDSKGKLKS